MPEPLTETQLDQLAERWAAQGAPVAERLRPGIRDSELDDITAAIGLIVPGEARTWWGWRDGAELIPVDRQSPPRLLRQHEMNGARWSILSLDEAVAEAVARRNLAMEVDPQEPEDLWNWDLLPLAVGIGGDVMAVDASERLQPTTRVCWTDPEEGAGHPTDADPTLGQLVTWWIEAIDNGGYSYDNTDEIWRTDPSHLPAGLLATSLS
jgi:hypothetical protein